MLDGLGPTDRCERASGGTRQATCAGRLGMDWNDSDRRSETARRAPGSALGRLCDVGGGLARTESVVFQVDRARRVEVGEGDALLTGLTSADTCPDGGTRLKPTTV